jgi:hypothetical protein
VYNAQVAPPKVDVTERFWRKTDTEANHPLGCWTWKGFGTSRRHPTIALTPNKFMYAARFAYLLCYGAIPDGLLILHTCDNFMCVNPDHLYPGTHTDNERDKLTRNRTLRGEKNTNSKLTENDVRDIRKLREAGMLLTEIAHKYNINITTVSTIAHRKTWAWLQDVGTVIIPRIDPGSTEDL